MDNPIVVFVVPGCFEGTLNEFLDKATKKMCPVGGKNNGCVEVANKGSEYSLLLLDDTTFAPAEAPCKVDKKKPLLILWHNTSTINKKPWNNLFGEMAKVDCGGFSHDEGGRVFENIKNFITSGVEPEKIEEFVKNYQNSNVLQTLDSLAAICQIRSLTNRADELKSLEKRLFDLCPAISRRDFLLDDWGYLQSEAERRLGFDDGR